MRKIKLFEGFDGVSGRPYRKIKPNFTEEEIMDIENTLISLLDDFCEKWSLKKGKSVSHGKINEDSDGVRYFDIYGPKIQWDSSCPMNLGIDVYSSDSRITQGVFDEMKNKMVRRLESKYHIFNFRKERGDIHVSDGTELNISRILLENISLTLGK
jgi:hypothetical protein